MKRESCENKGEVQKANLIPQSREEGFIGNPMSLFSDKEFNDQFVGSIDYKVAADSYFGSYSHFGIHEDMLKDKVRTTSYMRACLNNPEQFKDKVVLDIGCGTGILSIFAARAGAKHVYGIDNAEIADFAKAIVKNNHYSDRITIIKGKMEEITLPVKQVDIIISEWMGYFLLFESMLDTILEARDRYLRPGGVLMPDRACLLLAAIEDSNFQKEKYGFWDDVYGVKMDCIKKIALSEPLVDLVERDLVISNVCTFFDLDLYSAKKSDLSFSSEYEVIINRDQTVYGLGCWFDVYFCNLDNPVMLSTSPFSTPTHWRQTTFYLEEPWPAKKGDKLYGSIAVRKSAENFRDLDIKISFHLGPRSSTKLFKLR